MIESSGKLNSEPSGFTILHSASGSPTAQRMVTKSEMNIQSTIYFGHLSLQKYYSFRVIKLQHSKKYFLQLHSGNKLQNRISEFGV